MTAAKPGDRVKFSGEGVVTDVNGARMRIEAPATEYSLHVIWTTDPAVSVEVLPVPEPAWQDGDVVLPRALNIHTAAWWTSRQAWLYAGEWIEPGTPMWDACEHGTLLVRDGVPVNADKPAGPCGQATFSAGLLCRLPLGHDGNHNASWSDEDLS